MVWHKIDVDLNGSDFVKQISIGGKKLCLVKEQGQIYAVQNACPHAGGHLSGGWCKNEYIVCPIHRYRYNLKTGRGATGQGDYIDIYPTEKRADGYYVGLKKSWWKKLFT